jgi:hypothetical protein
MMEITEILQNFERATGKFPQAAVEEAAARREEITPELLRILEDTIERAPQLAEGATTWPTCMPCFCWRNSVRPAPNLRCSLKRKDR